ncbi:polysaccharide pyruvyl transferase CsaB [Microbacterium halimionae]|uniref:Polysaccharide pyruvyl transferase CsaB n=1 Tax=Microbacterium halimionae TaxID=1526413 RepID=A0A7W3JLG0_9MICO|nr:polysaccharide pyruvyl transferase family protein [Microbacterium halimionae]MBA8814998.1 polysaccharide pyruvyl transferase CsaB [Microbacterium halimionae]NII94211.1 polysaccharide pyruvyl transferase CsaB [Microbacterium halimionae]
MTDAIPTIVFLGTHGQYNIGDELLLETFLSQLGDQANYVINTYDPEFTERQLGGRYRAEFIDTATDRRALISHLRRADVLVFGGGSIIKELYASIGRHRYATLLMILAIVTFTRLVARAPIGMFNIGVGPLPSRGGRMLAKAILRQVSLVTVRDSASFALCQRLGLDARVSESADAVFSMSADQLLGESGAATPARGDVIRVGLNLNHDIENPDNWEHFQESLATAMSALADNRRIEIHGIPMQSRGKRNDDATMLEEFSQRIPNVSFVAHRPETTQDAARLIHSCDLIVSERLHAIVMASILGVPAFVLSYDVKVRGLAKALGLEEAMIDINGPINAPALASSLEQLLVDRANATKRLTARARVLAAQSSDDFDRVRQWLREKAR